MLVALLAVLASAASLDLVPRDASAKKMSTTVSTKGAAISTADFVAAVLDCENYPMTASVMGVKALFECKTLEKRADGYSVVYQRTGGNAFVSSRHYVIALKVVELTEARARVEWDLVRHTGEAGAWQGPYASALNAWPGAVYTPLNTGSWDYDKTAGSISYAVQSDPGGTLPGWLVTQDAVMAFPLELLETRWGVKP